MSKLAKLQKKSAEQIFREEMKRRESINPDSYIVEGDPDITLKKEDVGDGKCCFVMPEMNNTGKYILYIYDCDYCMPITKDEYSFVLHLAKETGMNLCIPMYPIAPEAGCRKALKMLAAVYENLVHKKHITDIILAGSGVGAGLALSLALHLWEEGITLPDKLLLLSPEVDSEFFDKTFEEILLNSYYDDGIYFSEGYKEFVNKYWVQEYAGQTEYTSPIYEDLRELCDNVIIISGTDDIFNCYARELARKIENAGLHVSYFEFPRMHHKFYHDNKLDETLHARMIMADLISDTRHRIIDQYMYEIKERGEWSKKYSEIFKDNLATKYLVNNSISYTKYKKENEFIDITKAATMRAFDDEVSKFILQYPMSTIVYLGCSLDTMFKRLDNGRVNWYNLDTPGKISIRKKYDKDSEREHTIVKSVDDMKWLDDIECDIGFGLLFVCRDIFLYRTSKEVVRFIEKIYNRYPGAQIVFNAPSYGGMVRKNMYSRKNDVDYKKYRLHVNDPRKDIPLWNVAYEVVTEKSVFSNIKVSKKWKNSIRIRILYNNHIRGDRLIRLRLGEERYRLYRDGHLIKV
ncbi:Acetyl esterase/lipase [Eubacterium ruminantium]|uniref:Acetyl esterase/lipase n=1 Tax=Eubacterium ruminantium TaxID=42322 RepID=A0A1T4PGR8_9FIRM|nr:MULTISPECIES: alpha/beta hydrolase fold domain-containing protein [Eubacterium]MCR5367821.1 alpha/beta hydrolase fold domain-containing protein [Eubacterium sp.]SCW59833.1 Acetyl esterase/lipase [Eubacterium ruminantium]SDN10239.1 Acetyl esterase/lipase [Eubacterium ruminantium]SJZ90750.1 Acetyl esterase/lipase [Eubacterium ruminantium]